MAVLPAPSFPPVIGESAGARIARIVHHYAGCSLHARREELAALVGRGVDDESIVAWETNCATFALGVLAAAGCPSTRLREPLRPGEAFTRLVLIGQDLAAWRVPAPSEMIPQGAFLWYEIPGTGDDHVEVLTEPPDEHGGGGRADNAVTVGRGDVHVSWSRPIHRWLDPEALQLPDASAGETIDLEHSDTEPPPAA